MKQERLLHGILRLLCEDTPMFGDDRVELSTYSMLTKRSTYWANPLNFSVPTSLIFKINDYWTGRVSCREKRFYVIPPSGKVHKTAQ